MQISICQPSRGGDWRTAHLSRLATRGEHRFARCNFKLFHLSFWKWSHCHSAGVLAGAARPLLQMDTGALVLIELSPPAGAPPTPGSSIANGSAAAAARRGAVIALGPEAAPAAKKAPRGKGAAAAAAVERAEQYDKLSQVINVRRAARPFGWPLGELCARPAHCSRQV